MNFYPEAEYHALHFKGWNIGNRLFGYTTIADTHVYLRGISRASTPNRPDAPFYSLVAQYTQTKGWRVVRRTHFKTRASAKRSAYRAYKAYQRKLGKEKEKRDSGYIPPKYRCGQCEQRRKIEGDYLCWECRYG